MISRISVFALLVLGVRVVGAVDFSDKAIETRLRSSAELLASDKLEGRGPRTNGLDLAAEYIAGEFKAAGLKVDLINDQPFQAFRNYDETKPGDNNSLVLKVDDAEQSLKLNEAFKPLSASASAKFDLPLVFAGYGITSEEAKYDDYAGIDVKGKAVVLLRHEPQQKDADSVFDGAANSSHAYLSSKIKNAIAHGAAAVVFVSDEIAVKAAGEKDNLLRFQIRADVKPTIPVFHAQRLPLNTVLAAAEKPLLGELERAIDNHFKPTSFAIPNARIQGQTEIVRSTRQLKNVIAELPGAGELAEETVVVGAHYDHLGRGGSGSLAPWTSDIHNGADDNASGTSCLLEIARQLAGEKSTSRRRILFIAFSGEELGLLGSEAYVRRPLYEMKNTVAMVNLDMVGRIREGRIFAHGVGTSPQFPDQIKTLCAKQELKPALRSSGYGPSDHASFYGRGVPVIHFFSGFHADYHRPSDDADKLNISGMRQISAVSTELTKSLATQKERPEVRRDDLLDDLYDGDTPFTAGKPFLGVGIEKVEGGLAVNRVFKDSPAATASIRVGDILLKLDGAGTESVDALKKIIADHKPGDKLKALIKRRDVEMEVEIELKAK